MPAQVKGAVSFILLLLFPWLLAGGIYFIEGLFGGFHWATYIIVTCLFIFSVVVIAKRLREAPWPRKMFALISYLPTACVIAYIIAVSVAFNLSPLYFASVDRGTHEYWTYVFKTNGTYQRACWDMLYEDLEYGSYRKNGDTLLLTPLLKLTDREAEWDRNFYPLTQKLGQPRQFVRGGITEYFNLSNKPIYVCGSQNTIEFGNPADTAIFKP